MNKAFRKIISVSRDALIAILSSAITAAFGYYTFEKQHIFDEKLRLNQNLNKLLEIDMQYPFLEDSSYITKWDANKSASNDSALRYQYYCIYVFNFVQDLCEYYHYDKTKIDNFVDINDLIGMHEGWWDSPENQGTQSHDEKFKNFVDDLYKHVP